MQILNENSKTLLQQAMTRLKEVNGWTYGRIVGMIVGNRVSMLGATQDKRSLYPIFVYASKVISDVNECCYIDTDAAESNMRSFVTKRWETFFSGQEFSVEKEDSDYAKWLIDDLSRANPSQDAHDVVRDIEKILLGAGISNVIHENATPAPVVPAKKEQNTSQVQESL